MIKRFFIFAIRSYQFVLSPFLGEHCRFYPSCSDYAIRTIYKDGIWKGTLKALWRIIRCNPLTKGGIDYP